MTKILKDGKQGRQSKFIVLFNSHNFKVLALKFSGLILCFSSLAIANDRENMCLINCSLAPNVAFTEMVCKSH